MMGNHSQNLTEKFLYHIWDGGHLLLDQLKTIEGQHIDILFKGRWNMDTGPDFKGAIIKFDGELRKGDVEIHIQPNDWYQHNHHLDENYNNVILHVVLSCENHYVPCKTKCDSTAPTLRLVDFLDESVSRLQTKSEEPGPIKKNMPELCLLRDKSLQKIYHTLDYWGIKRFELKKEKFKEERNLFQFNDLLYQGICEALGYSKNRQPFLKLSFILPVPRLWEAVIKDNDDEAAMRLQGILFGTAGFLDSGIPSSGELSRFEQRLKFYWIQYRDKYTTASMTKTEWQFFRLRPLNFPTIKIAGLSQLLVNHRRTGFLQPLLALFRDLHRTPAKIFPQLQHQFIVNGYGFWRSHFRLEETNSTKRDYKLIGVNKTREIVINVVLPILWAYAEEADDYELQAVIKQVYLQAPKLESNQFTRRMIAQLGLKSKTRKIHLSACQQQGMLHLFHRYCQQWFCHNCLQLKEMTK